MADICDYAIAQEIAADCDNPLVAGLDNEGIIGNFADIDEITYDDDNPNIVTDLTLASGKQCYKVVIPGKTPFTGTTTALAAGTYINGFTKTVSLVVLRVGPDVAHNIIDRLANGRFFVILKNRNAGSDGRNTYEIYGLEAGLTATALDNDKYSEDTKGGWSVTLQEESVPKSGLFFCKNSNSGTFSLAATKAAITSLCTAAD